MSITLFSNKNRSKRALQNIGVSILIKGGSILISFLLVPLTLDYLNTYEYGIWLTINSILSWVYLFDIGLGNGLRNKLTEAIANNNYWLGKIYVSTTYFCMALIISVVFILFLIAQHWLQWDRILNVNPEKISNLNLTVSILFCFFCLSFIFRLIGNIFLAKQLSSANDLLAFLGNALALIIIYICTKTTSSSLLLVCIILSGAPLIVYMVATPFVFHRYPNIAPSVKDIKFNYFHSLVTLGAKFLIIQIASLILYMTSNLIISQLFGPEEVTPYNISYKLFSVCTIAFNIILTPFWSAITDAYTKKEYLWVQKTNKKILLIWILFTIGSIIILFASNYIYQIWIGNSVNINFSLSAVCALYVTLYNWCNIWAYMINGTGKLQLSIILAILQAIIYIPLAISLGKILGIVGVVLSLCICMIISGIVSPIQYYKIFYSNPSGIWSK